ncbi:MAG TPA: DUF1501 domain-containing protein [Hydrogenophaga sp.]|nr:DUF1501 domain-containing protein [Hydrogenophaga sp.]HMN91879.1 DUF1501 domain-containing protein [Hydrogenophaga sp.]
MLSGAAGAAAAPLALNLMAMSTAAAQTSDYRAIVCLFLFGGNDAANMVLATDTESWAQYVSARQRDPDPLALRPAGTPPNDAAVAGSPDALGGILPISPANGVSSAQNVGRTFALHPSMSAVQGLFASGRLSIVANVGPLVEPIAHRDEFRIRRRPPQIESHNDQQYLWQALAAEGARTGWGGRLGDMLASRNSNTLFTNISASGNAVFLAGQQTFQYQVSGNNGATAIGGLTGQLFGSSAAAQNFEKLIRGEGSQHLIARDYAAITGRSIDAQAAFSEAFNATASRVPPPDGYLNPQNRQVANNGLATQLRTVLRTMAAREQLGTRRQIFFVSIGGFDTHDFQNGNHARLMAQISHALGYFDEQVTALGLRDNVTLFTASDFGRTFDSNGNGTDHAWGAHHFVYGGAGLRGGQIFGRFPEYGFRHADSYGNRGNWIPQIAVDQFGATLGRWFGVGDSDLNRIFPNLGNFERRNLGIYG